MKSGQKRTDFTYLQTKDLLWSGFQTVGTTDIDIAKNQTFEIQPSKSQDFKHFHDFKCFQISNCWISDPHYTWARPLTTSVYNLYNSP